MLKFNVPCTGAAINPPHSNAEGAGLKEIMVGKAFNKLSEIDSQPHGHSV